MGMPRITYVQVEAGDWMGVYVDGILEYEGHSMTVPMLLDVLVRTHILDDVVIDTFWDYKVDEGAGNLPTRANDLRAH